MGSLPLLVSIRIEHKTNYLIGDYELLIYCMLIYILTKLKPIFLYPIQTIDNEKVITIFFSYKGSILFVV